MKITVYGAARDVTGSCHLVESGNDRVLIDCGMFQGSEKLERLNYIPKGLHPHDIKAMVLTHGHLDHCGRIPMLVKEGFRGKIFCTEPTAELARLILTDSAKIQEEDTQRENRKRAHNGLEPLKPLYGLKEVDAACSHFSTVRYGESFKLTDDIDCTLVDAGHILGSASVEMVARTADGASRHLVFSGDIGQFNVPIMEDPAQIKEADVVLMESTYGERDHRAIANTIVEFETAIKQAVANGGKVLIPTFAVGRSQLILYLLAKMFRKGAIASVPVYLDSPMAIAASAIYSKFVSFMDAEARDLQISGELAKDLQTLRMCTTVDESKALNSVPGPCIILAGSGMCNAGRILHHLLINLPDPRTLVLIVGYQPKGSLGRLLVEGATSVRLLHETVPVRATSKGLGGFSAHAGKSDLLRWLEPMTASKPKVVLVHGEAHAMDELAFAIEEKFGITPDKPKLGDSIDLNWEAVRA